MTEDAGTVSGKVPLEVSGDKGGTTCHGSPPTLTDEVPGPRVVDTSGRLPSAPEVSPFEECTGVPDIRTREEPPCVPVANLGTISYSCALHGSNLYYTVEVSPKVPVYVPKTVA